MSVMGGNRTLDFRAGCDVGHPTSTQYSLTRDGIVWNLHAMVTTVIPTNFTCALLAGAKMRALGASLTWRWSLDSYSAAARWHSW